MKRSPQSLILPVDMHQNFSLCLIWLFLGMTSVFANDFHQANEQFKTGDFTAAAASYEKILTAEGPRAEVFYNLGNSYQQLKQYGPAILAYERAVLLTPRDPALLANLALARKAAAISQQSGPYPRLDGVLNYLSRNEWSWLVAGGALFLGGLAVACGAVKLPRQWVLGFAGFAGICIITGATALYLRRAETRRGVILASDAAVRLSPFEKAESVGTVSVGRIIRLGVKNGNFRYIEVPGTSLSGWLADKDVAAVAPEILR